ncbi:MAG: 30S ribosomal protein S7 [Gammaproteobacteria bacterium]|nr:30S ribosomal protein S7 [Gammaproteobacteria bacterium]
MSRRSAAPVRIILGDPLFKEVEITKFINSVMRNGKKSVAEKIVYGALNIVALRSKGKIKKNEDETGGESGGKGSKTMSSAAVSIWNSDELRKVAFEIYESALSNVMPAVEVKSRRVGGSTYQVPVEVRDSRRKALGKRWLVLYAQQRGEKSMPERLAGEILDAANKRGGAFKKMEDVHRTADANKAFIHFRW